MDGYTGGYLATRCSLVALDHLDGRHELHVSDAAIAAVNRLQSVAWKLNEFTAGVFFEARARGDMLGGLPSSESLEVPTLEKAKLRRLDTEAKREFFARRETVLLLNKEADEERRRVDRIALAASIMQGIPEFYYPATLDFRGRLYTLPQDLQPQAGDIAKGLLRFRDEQRLDSEGERWIRIAIANAAGQDKISFDDRTRWTDAHRELLLDSAADPLNGERFWCSSEVDEPWTLLALVHDWSRGVSSVPCSVDATASGLQILAALVRCAVTAPAVNLLPGRRRDLYAETAARVGPVVSLHALRGSPEAALWQGLMQTPKAARKIVKSPIMTTPYGASRWGRASSLVPSALEAGVTLKGAEQAATWLAGVIEEVLGESIPGPMLALAALKSWSTTIHKSGSPITWTAPSGSVVTQHYQVTHSKQTRTRIGRVSFMDDNPERELDVRKGSTAFAPSFVHSCDASHLVSVLNKWDGEITCVHDAIGTHANRVGELHALGIEQFAAMYRRDVLGELRDELSRRHPELAREFILPVYGELNIEDVAGSCYLFS
jgi:DNA-directed RNA polymerase